MILCCWWRHGCCFVHCSCSCLFLCSWWRHRRCFVRCSCSCLILCCTCLLALLIRLAPLVLRCSSCMLSGRFLLCTCFLWCWFLCSKRLPGCCFVASTCLLVLLVPLAPPALRCSSRLLSGRLCICGCLLQGCSEVHGCGVEKPRMIMPRPPQHRQD